MQEGNHRSVHRHDFVAECVFRGAAAFGTAEMGQLQAADAVACRPDLGVCGAEISSTSMWSRSLMTTPALSRPIPPVHDGRLRRA